ncbi:M24 family metallopeptidase [Spiroplasma endosymbiont of Virgichneumon dumeticola]|uniref:M24 family metallopeptidase n=1 Tax=Spiroplasma endosymbiont of Virgichneumon dumeticola TaxID=3139323 RepID=UPI0035C8C983
MNSSSKHETIKKILSEQKIDAMLFYAPENRFWYSDFISTLGYLLIDKTNATLLLDGRYITESKLKAKNVNCQDFTNPFVSLTTISSEQKIKTIGFEAEYITYAQLESWEKAMPNITFKPVYVHDLRAIKDEAEVKRIAKACAIGDLAFNEVLSFIKPGVSEKDVEDVILRTFTKYGATKASFDTIVASGVRGSMPHGKASDKLIANNELVTCDFGCVYEGFCSDMTRTFAIGNIVPKLNEIHEIVKAAQMAGIKAVKPGIAIGAIDKICRDYINEKGYGQYFTHGTGHGLGIEIHEAPWVIKDEPTILVPGMVITVEPGIYIPNLGGVRIEDDILVTKDGYEILTKSLREINVWKENK